MHSTRFIVATFLVALTASITPAQSHGTLTETLVRGGQDATLVKLVQLAGLEDTLNGRGPFTVFAPTEKAFSRLPKETVARLTSPEGRDELRKVLLYHVVPGRLGARAVVSADELETAADQSIRVTKKRNGRVVLNGDTDIVATNIEAANGIVHRIDRVLLPSNPNIVDVAAKAGQFETLIAAAKAAGLVPALTGDGPLTVFAPTDKAFSLLGSKAIKDLLRPENKARLAAILKYHVVSGRVLAADAVRAGRAPSLLERGGLEFGIRDGRLRVQNAGVIANDISASNGVIHIIDRVLIPEEKLLPKTRPAGRKMIGVTLDSPGGALASQLDLDAHKTSVVASVTKGGTAQKAGLRKYDVILSIEGGDGTVANLRRAKKRRDFGESIKFVIIRKGERRMLEIPIGVEAHR